MSTLVSVIHIVACVFLVLVVLIQSGKGAEISASFSGSSQTVFGSSGGANFFTRFTAAMAAIFMVTSLVLTVLGGQAKKSLFEGPASSSNIPVQGAPVAPAQNPVPGAPGQPAAPAQNAAPAAPATK